MTPAAPSATTPDEAPAKSRMLLAAASNSIADRRVMAVVTICLISVTFLQRFVVPLGPLLSLSVPIVLLGLAYLLYQGDAVENPAATRWFLVAVAVCSLAAGLALLLNRSGSLTSLLYLPVIWVAFAIRLHPERWHLYPRVLRRFESLMVFFGALGILQTLTQALGVWTYQDYVLSVVPENFLFTGYNTSYPVEYGSPIIKANGFFFNEPSIFAQFLAVALLSVLVRRGGVVRGLVLAAALACTISGTGLLFAVFGMGVLALRRGGLWTLRIVVAAVVVGVAVLLSPFGQIFLKRSTETSSTNSSGNLRFVLPYEEIGRIWSEQPVTMLLGKGAGFADALANQILELTKLPINFSGVAKLVLEYGIPAAVLFCVFVALVWVRRCPSPTLGWSAVFGSALLTGSLLQPQVLYVFVPLISMFIGHRFEQVLDDERREAMRAAPTAPVDAGAAATGVTVTPASPNGVDPGRSRAR
ncbi:hypothetical protein ACFFKU_14540 [Kineococcus gynurae]|uniref:O-antigen ligase n=1 Tax=Kineococcus gynurae TaxID=452979 RepID=A0ABV5LTV6_9ACTN